jgi:hypothetical protein
MSDERLQISDMLESRKFSDSNTLDRISNISEISDFFGDIFISTSNVKLSQSTINSLRRLNFSKMSPSQTFIFNTLKTIPQTIILKDEINWFLWLAKSNVPNIQFKNPFAILFGFRYLRFLMDPTNQRSKDLSQWKKYSSLTQLMKDANENNVPSFDVVRYSRFLISYLNYEQKQLIIKNISNRNFFNQYIKKIKIPQNSIIKSKSTSERMRDSATILFEDDDTESGSATEDIEELQNDQQEF